MLKKADLILECLFEKSVDWIALGQVDVSEIRYQPARVGSPSLNYVVFRRSYKCTTHYYLCTEVLNEFVIGMLTSFDDVLIGEHLTLTPRLNVVKCVSGVYPGFGECTLQMVIQKSVWNAFMPLYYALLDYGVDWTSLFDLGLCALIRYLANEF